MALAADVGGYSHWRARFEGLDLVLRMAVSACGGLLVARCDSFAVNALGYFLLDLVMARAARLSQP